MIRSSNAGRSMALAAVALALLAQPFSVRADEASDYLAAAGDQAESFGQCTIEKANPLMRSQLTAEEVAARAVQDCADKIPPIKAGLMGKPTFLASSKADQVVSDVVSDAQAHIVEIVKAKRTQP